MKIRYYLRGLGLGILFTAVFFLICGDTKQTMSDEMIKERAKKLGMVESTVLADIEEKTSEEILEETKEEMISSVQETESVEMEETTDAAVLEEDSQNAEEAVEETVAEEFSKAEEVKEPESVQEAVLEEPESVKDSEEPAGGREKPSDGQVISIMVNKGEGSDTVSQRLYEAGLVEDPYEYDRYLMQNGYDRRISAGEHLIPSGSDWQEIAKLLCS